MKHQNLTAWIGAIGMALPLLVHGQATTVNDDFTQANDTNSWKTFGGACLTAGDGTGSIPSCVGLPYYANQVQVGGSNGYLGNTSKPASGSAGVQTPDAAGSGALRLTNGNNTRGKSGFAIPARTATTTPPSGPTGAFAAMTVWPMGISASAWTSTGIS